jgi:protein-S-isoprenylcysteine O-methyltransferase Ste14
MVILKTFVFTLIAPGTFAGLVPYLVVTHFSSGHLGSHSFIPTIGILVFGIGVSTYLYCAWEFARAHGTPAPIDPPKELVVKGLYRLTRNPMYVGVLCILLGESMFFVSVSLLLYMGFVFIVFELFITLYEEPTLARLFGGAYKQYRNRVPRWFV